MVIALTEEPPTTEVLAGKHGRLNQTVMWGSLVLAVSAVGMAISVLALGKEHSITAFFALTAAAMYGVIFIPAWGYVIYEYFTTSKSMVEILSAGKSKKNGGLE